MRTGVRVHSVGFVGGTDLRILEVRSETWREYWFVSRNTAPDTYTLDCYLTEADAIADTNLIASATHAASPGGDTIEVPMVAAVSPVLDPTPMSVVMTAQGSWTSARIAWTHNVTGLLVDRVKAILNEYRAPGEVLEGLTGIGLGHGLPEVLPAGGISSGAVTMAGGMGAQLEQDQVQIELHAWVARLKNELAYKDAMRFGSAFLTIAEEQRTWGGLAMETRVAPPAQITLEESSGGGLLYHALVVVIVTFSDLTATRTAASDDYATGGKYAAAVA